MNRNLVDLFYGSGTKAFNAAIAPRQIYEDIWLFEKWKQKLFLQKMEAEIFPSYYFGSDLHTFLILFPRSPKLNIKKFEERFSEAPEDFLRATLKDSLPCGRYFPQIFRDLYAYYPKYELSFSEVEFVYLDYGSQLPKVFDSLLSELLVRDEPFGDYIPAKRSMMFFDQEAISPPRFVDTLSNEALHAHVINFLSGDEPENYFFKVVNLYLKARPEILATCTKDLLEKGLEISDRELAEYFLGVHIFKSVSLDALKFIVVNSNLSNKNPFKATREVFVEEGESFNEERRQKVITRFSNSLEEIRRKVEKRASQTHEEKVAVKEAFLKQLADPTSAINKELNAILSYNDKNS